MLLYTDFVFYYSAVYIFYILYIHPKISFIRPFIL